MKIRQECSRRCAMQAPLVQLLVFVVIFLCVGVSFVDAVDIRTNAWLNQPTAIWSLIEGQATASAAVKLSIGTDLTSLLRPGDVGVTVVVTALTPYSSTTGLAYGANAAFTVTSTVLTEADILRAVRGGSLVSTSTAVSSLVSTSLSIRVLIAESPARMTAVGPALLPVTGSTFAWGVAIETIESGPENSILGLTIPLGEDLQSAVSTDNQFLVVAGAQGFITNASSMYFPYSLWAYPGVTVSPTTSVALQTLARTSKLLSLNSFLATIGQVYPTIALYKDIIPTNVLPWIPLPGNPFDPSLDEETKSFKVISELTGNYFLTFSGEAGRWDVLLKQNSDALSKAITEAIRDILDSANLRINATIVSASTLPTDSVNTAGLQVLCHLVQGVTLLTMRVWPPEELAAMLLQADFSAVQTLYGSTGGGGETNPSTPPATLVEVSPFVSSPGSIVSARVDYDYRFVFTKELVGIIAMSSVIVVLIVVVVIVSLTCCCCCCCEERLRSCMNTRYADLSRKASHMDDPEEGNNIREKNNFSSEASAGLGEGGLSAREYQNAPDRGHSAFKRPNPLSP